MNSSMFFEDNRVRLIINHSHAQSLPAFQGVSADSRNRMTASLGSASVVGGCCSTLSIVVAFNGHLQGVFNIRIKAGEYDLSQDGSLQ